MGSRGRKQVRGFNTDKAGKRHGFHETVKILGASREARGGEHRAKRPTLLAFREIRAFSLLFCVESAFFHGVARPETVPSEMHTAAE
jgi:hypothetical protein